MTVQGAEEMLRANALREHVLDVFERAGEPVELRGPLILMEPYFDLASFRARAVDSIDYESFGIASQKFIDALSDGAGPFHAVASERERSLLGRALKNHAAMVEMMHWMLRRQSDAAQAGDRMKMAKAREVNMAETLIWLASEYYRDRKLIVWAASSHLTYNASRVEMPTGDGGWAFDDGKWQPMGDLVREALGEDFYVIDCIAYDGEIGSLGRWSRLLEPAPAGSWDALCHETGHEYLFVDLRTLPSRGGGQWMTQRLVARPRGYGPMRANWAEICDAFLFTDTMYPSDRTIEPSKPAEKTGDADDADTGEG